MVAMQGSHAQPERGWTTTFVAERSDLSSTGRNAFFVLVPGYTLTLEGGATRLVITVLSSTAVVDGVETRVVEERETEHGKLVEVSRNYFAISRKTSSVFYFGEDVDMYNKGAVSGHEGSWRSGVGGARFGLAMPGEPLIDGRYYQEIAPNVAMDRARVVSVTDTLSTPAGKFTNVLVTEETTQLERGKEYKRYARGVGLIQDGDLTLVSHR
jgi:hypothetical protein